MSIKSATIGLLLFFSLTVFSQTREGRFLLNGSTGFMKYDTEQADTASSTVYSNFQHRLGVNMRGGYFIADELALGLLRGIRIVNMEHAP